MSYTYRYLFVIVASMLVQQTSMPMNYFRRGGIARRTGTARTTATTASPQRAAALRTMSTEREPESEATSRARAAAPSVSEETINTQFTTQPKRTWGQWFAGLFGYSATPRIQKQAVSFDNQTTISPQNTLERSQMAEQKRVGAFKKAMINAPSHSDLGIFDTDDIETIKKREKLIEENLDYINLPIAFKDTWRSKGMPHHSITILHQLLRTLVQGYYTDKKHMLIQEYDLWHRKPEVWAAEIALIEKVIELGGELGDSAEEALFETLKRKAAIEELLPTIYTQYFKNNINNLLQTIAAMHHLNYDRLEKDARAAVAGYVFKEKNRKAQAYKDMKELLGMDEVPTKWDLVEDALVKRGIIQEPIKKSEFVKTNIGQKYNLPLFRPVINDEAAKIITTFRWAHWVDKKYDKLNSAIDDLFREKFINGEYQKPDTFTHRTSPKLIEAPSAQAYRTLGVNAQMPWKEIEAHAEKLLDQNDPTYESDPMQRREKEAKFEEVMQAFKILKANRAERIQQRFQELKQQEQQRYKTEHMQQDPEAQAAMEKAAVEKLKSDLPFLTEQSIEGLSELRRRRLKHISESAYDEEL